jgi:hypothetical protein
VIDERPVIKAPTAEELSGEIGVVRGPTSRTSARERRVARHQRRRRRRVALLLTGGLVIAAAGGAAYVALDDSNDVEPKVSGVSVTKTTSTIPAVPTTVP